MGRTVALERLPATVMRMAAQRDAAALLQDPQDPDAREEDGMPCRPTVDMESISWTTDDPSPLRS